MHPNEAIGKADSIDPDQTLKQSRVGPNSCFLYLSQYL